MSELTYEQAVLETDPARAALLFEALVEKIGAAHGLNPGDAQAQVKRNLGYTAGWYSEETRERVERLYGAVHPVLGPVSRHLTIDKIMELGAQSAQAGRMKEWDEDNG